MMRRAFWYRTWERKTPRELREKMIGSTLRGMYWRLVALWNRAWGR